MQIYMDTPVGEMPIPKRMTEPYQEKTAEEVQELMQAEKKRTGFVDPVLMAVWRHKVVYEILGR